MEIAIILKIIICHWIGDGLLQTEKMATQKNSSNYWLSAHVGAYILPFIVVFYNILGWVLLMAILHWIQDWITSRINTQYLQVKNNRMLIFPSMIPHQVDNVKMDSEYKDKGLGRFCIANLMNNKTSVVTTT